MRQKYTHRENPQVWSNLAIRNLWSQSLDQMEGIPKLISGSTPKTGIVTFPLIESGITPLSNLVDILHSLSDRIYLITGNAGYDFFRDDTRICTYGIEHKSSTNKVSRILKYIYAELRISYTLVRISKDIDVFFFTLGGEHLFLPMMTARLLLRKKVMLQMAASPGNMSQIQKDPLSHTYGFFEKLNCILTSKIILYSPRLIKEWDLTKHNTKIIITSRHFLNFDRFRVQFVLSERMEMVGYVGRLSEEKGVLEFVEAIPAILDLESSVRFLIGGDGQLRERLQNCICEEGLQREVCFPGWISRNELPDYLNILKLLVLPSHTEGLPNIMLEAMACGTPVLCAPIGAIPDIIIDGKTGFIMENNSADCIAQNVIRALNHPDIDKIVENARALVQKEFTFKAVVDRYENLLSNV